MIARLVDLIPRANFVDSSGTPRFISSASAPVNVDQWTTDINFNLSPRDRLHGYHAIQRAEITEPTRSGTTIPGFGNTSRPLRQIFTLNETHTFGTNVVNEARVGFNRFSSSTTPNAQLNPADFGILNGVNQPIGLPQINVAGGASILAVQPPSRRDGATPPLSWLTRSSWLYGPHSLKFGGEYRQFLNNNFRQGTGSFNFPTVAAFLAGTANSFSVTLGNQTSSIAQGAVGIFCPGQLQGATESDAGAGPALRMEHDAQRALRSIHRLRSEDCFARARRDTNIDEIYHENNKNFQPRVGFAWTPFSERQDRTARSVRDLCRPTNDQYRDAGTSGNPPLAIPLTFTGSDPSRQCHQCRRSSGSCAADDRP